MEEFDLERADLDGGASLDGAQVGFGGHAVAGEFDFDQAEGQIRSENGSRDAAEDVVDGPDVVFVSVCDDNPGHLVAFIV